MVCACVCVYMRTVGLFGDPGFYSCTTAQPTLAFYAFMYECVCVHLCVCVCSCISAFVSGNTDALPVLQ